MCGSLGEEGPGHGLGDSKRFQLTTSNERRPNLSEVPPFDWAAKPGSLRPSLQTSSSILPCSALSQVNGAPNTTHE